MGFGGCWGRKIWSFPTPEMEGKGGSLPESLHNEKTELKGAALTLGGWTRRQRTQFTQGKGEGGN